MAMTNPVRIGSAAVAAAVVAGLCGAGDAFVVGGGGAVTPWRTAHTCTEAFSPLCHGSSCGRRPTSTMALRFPLPILCGGNPKTNQVSQSWRTGPRGAGGVARTIRRRRAAAGDGEGKTAAGGGAGGERGEEVVAARRGRFARPAAVLRFVREAVEQGARKAGKRTRARIASWRRRVSVAMIGVAAALIVMTASVGPAEALFGVNLPSRQQGPPARLTKMPESVYVRREELQDFCQTPPSDRLFDFKDLTVYDEVLDGLDMFADNIAPTAGARESFRLKYIRHAEDFLQDEAGDRKNGAYGVARFAFLGTVGLVAVGTVLGSFLWTCRAFLNMAREEEVFLYGEEISVDATEKEEEELDDLDDDLDFDEDDMEDYGSPASGDGVSPPPPSTPPPSDFESGGGDSDAGDDLLDI
eukprot:g18865.t1